MMSCVCIGNLDRRVFEERELEDEFRVYGIVRRNLVIGGAIHRFIRKESHCLGPSSNMFDDSTVIFNVVESNEGCVDGVKENVAYKISGTGLFREETIYGMAYAAVLHLKHILEEEVICFLRKLLEVEKAKAVEFQTEANDGLKRLQISRNPNNEGCNHPFFNLLRRLKISRNLRCRRCEGLEGVRGDLLLESIESILNDLDDISTSLEGFLHSLDGSSSSQQREIANDLLSGNRKIRASLSLCRQTSEAAISLRKTVRNLAEYERWLSADGVLSRIRMTASKAADSIADLLAGFQEDKDNYERMKNMFDELKQIDEFLQLKDDENQLISEIMTEKIRLLEDPEAAPCLTDQLGLSHRDDLAKALEENDHSLPDVIDDNRLCDVIDALFGQPRELKVVRIWEASTNEYALAQQVHHHPDVSRHFDCRAYVDGACSADQLLSKIWYSLFGYSHLPESNIEDEGEFLFRSLEGRKYLIVLHGLQNFEIWDAIERYFPDDKVGSRVLLVGVLNPGNSWKSLMEHEDAMVGLDEKMSKIIDELTRPPSTLSIVTIAGMGGIGKTTLAKMIFKHPSVSHYFHCLAWINNVSSTDQVLSLLLHRISSLRDEEILGQSPEDKGVLLYRNLKGRKYLIVVDDLWNFEVWDAVQRYLPDDKMGSRILVTTRMVEFPACISIRKNPPHCMALMDKDRSWELLENLLFEGKRCPDELVEIGKQIAEACGGLPLAVVVIAGFLCSISTKSAIVWGRIMRKVIPIITANSEVCMNILSLSYKNLPGHLKACFLYVGIFPANSEIEVEYLLRLWVANGFLKSKFSNYLEIEAEEYLNNIIGRNLVSIGKRGLDGKIKTCFIHPLVRQLCLGEAQKENFMHVLEPNALAHVQENQRHLIFNRENSDDFQSLRTHPHLCSFIWINRGSDFTPGMVLLQMLVCKWLRVLDIYFLSFDTFPLELLNLVNLRFLAINVNYELDARISQLSKLETFIVYGPWGSKPDVFLEFWKMLCLRNVLTRVPSCLKYPYLLRSLLAVPQAPSNLQVLSVITFSSCTRELFLLMPNLRKLGVSETKEDFENGELTKCSHNLSFLNKLQVLNCSFYEANRDARQLDLHVLPVSLKKLTLDGGNMSWEKISFLALLPKLETLKLKNHAFQGPEWVVTEEVFGSLKHLLIENTDLVNWEVDSTDQFPCLNRLVLRLCKFLEKIPEGVGELSVLEVIELHHCSESANISAREYEEQYGFPKVVCSG